MIPLDSLAPIPPSKPHASPAEGFLRARRLLASRALRILSEDTRRPWGGFFCIDPAQTPHFLSQFFPELPPLEAGSPPPLLSPKILIVRPGQRLSWQYHLRRSERWKILEGPALLHSSANDSPSALRHLATGDSVHLPTGERHRMEALERWAIAAEIWIHSDPLRPSDENDIVRIADDFGR